MRSMDFFLLRARTFLGLTGKSRRGPSPVRTRPLRVRFLVSPSLRKPSFPQRLLDAAASGDCARHLASTDSRHVCLCDPLRRSSATLPAFGPT